MIDKRVRRRLGSLADVLLFGLGAKGVGFVVPIVIAAAFGVSRKTDGFFLALAISTVLTAIWGQSVEQFCVPLLAEVGGGAVVAGRMKWLVRRSLAGSLGSYLVVGVALVAYLELTGSTSRGVALLCYALLVPQVVASSWGAVQSAYLISRAQFRWSVGSVALRAIGVLILVALSPRSAGVLALAAGYSLGEISRSWVLATVARRHCRDELSPRGSIVPRGDTIRRAGHQLGSMAVVGVASVVERSIAATLGIGAISRLEYASKIFYIPSVVFDTNFVSFFLGEWSQLTAAGHYRALRRDVLRASTLVFTGSCVIAGLVLTYRLPLVHLVLARGALPLSETSRVASVVGVLIMALPFYCAAMLLAGAAVALGENRLVMHVALVKVGIRSGGAALLAIPLGLQGIALAFVASHAAECVLYLARTVPVFRNRAIVAGDISTGPRRPLQPATTAIITAEGLTNVP